MLRIFKIVKKYSILFFYIAFFAIFFGCSSTIKLKEPLNISSKSWATLGGNCGRTNICPSEIKFPLEEAWEYNGNAGIGPFSPVFSDSLIIIGFLNGEVHALNVFKGKKIGNVNLESAVSASPCIERNFLYLPLANGENSLRAYEFIDGKLSWKKKINGIESSPLIIGYNLYTATTEGEVFCIDKRTGNTKWKQSLPKSIHSSPASDSIRIIIGCEDGYLYSIDKDSGKIEWKYFANSPIFATPLIKNGAVFFGSENGQYYRLNTVTGLSDWTFVTNSPIKYGSALSDSAIFFTTIDGSLFSVNSHTGKLNWEFKAKSVICAAPTISGNYVLISSYDRKTYIFEKNSGQLVWEYESEGRVKTSPMVFSGYLIICSEDYNIKAFKSK